MNIERKTLAEKQAFWNEQLPLFKEAYWLHEHFELLKFDMEAGNFIVRDDMDPAFEDDADELYHRINTGWSMWKRAINLMQKKLEGCAVVPVQCPDPDFADMLFDELRKYAIGTFGDDMLIHFSNIDEEKIWALMIEAARVEMSNQSILDAAPKGATHYFLVPNGSGEPYFVLEKANKFYWFYTQDEITKPHILSWIKSIESLKEPKADVEE